MNVNEVAPQDTPEVEGAEVAEKWRMPGRRFIAVTGDEKRWLAKAMRVSAVTVWQALTFERSNDIHRRIRQLARKRGAAEMWVTDKTESVILRSRGGAAKKKYWYLLHELPNGNRVEACLNTGIVEIRNKEDKTIVKVDNPTMTEFGFLISCAK